MASYAASPEFRFVFRAADPRCTAAELLGLAARIRDWPRVARLAEAEGATAVLWRLLRGDADALPPEFAAFLHARTMLADYRMQRLARRAQETVVALREAGIPVLLLKGAAVGALFDPTFRSRPMTDVDLLITESDVTRAQECLRAKGWHEMDDPALRDLLQGHQHLTPFVDPTLEGLRLELHTRLLPRENTFAMTAADLWAHAAAASDAFAGAKVPDLARLFVHTAIHFAWQHELHFGPWRTVRSVALLTQSPSWSWEQSIAVAQHARAVTSCYWTLRTAAAFAGVDVPSNVLRTLAPPTPELVMAVCERQFAALADPHERLAAPSVRLEGLLWRLALRPKWSGNGRRQAQDPERRWERRADRLEATRASSAQTSVSGGRHWWNFLAYTLVGLPR